MGFAPGYNPALPCFRPGSELDRLRRNWEAYDIAQGANPAAAALRAQQMVVNRRLSDIRKTRQRLWLQTDAHVRGIDRINAAHAAGQDPSKGLTGAIERRMRGDDRDMTVWSIRMSSIATGDNHLADFTQMYLERADLSVADRTVFNTDVRRELLGVDTGNVPARRAADSYRTFSEWRRAELNDLGMDIHELDTYGYSRSYITENVAPDGDTTAFVDYLEQLYSRPGVTAPLLDDTGAPLIAGTPEMRAVLERIAENISNQDIGGSIGRTPSAMRSRYSQARVIHILDPAERIAFEDQFCDVDLLAMSQRTNLSTAREVSMMQMFGPNPDRGYAMQRDHAQRLGARHLYAVDILYEQAAGKLDQPASVGLARVGATLRAATTAARMAGAILSQFSDFGTRGMVAAGNNTSVLRNVGDFFSEMVTRQTPDRIATAKLAGADAHIAISMLEDAATAYSANAMRRVSDGVLRYTLFSRVNNIGLRISELNVMRKLASIRHLDFAAANAEIGGRLSRYGYSSAEWDSLRSLVPQMIDGTEYLSIESVMGANMPREQARRLAQRLMHHVKTDGAISMNNPMFRTRAFTSWGLKSGTPAGELARSVMQFKGYATQAIMNNVGEILRRSGGDRARYIAGMLLAYEGLGMISLQSKRIIKGQGLADMSDPKVWGAAFMQAGGLGLVGDLAVAGAGGTMRNGQDLYSWLAGPNINTVVDLSKLTLGNLRETAAGERANTASEAIKFVGQNMPGANAPFIGLAWNRWVIEPLRLMADEPGTRRSFQTMASKQRTEFNSEYWWQQGETLPEFLK